MNWQSIMKLVSSCTSSQSGASAQHTVVHHTNLSRAQMRGLTYSLRYQGCTSLSHLSTLWDYAFAQLSPAERLQGECARVLVQSEEEETHPAILLAPELECGMARNHLRSTLHLSPCWVPIPFANVNAVVLACTPPLIADGKFFASGMV